MPELDRLDRSTGSPRRDTAKKVLSEVVVPWTGELASVAVV
jgi:hypothetical protein